jgi:serine/threonine protein kinase
MLCPSCQTTNRDRARFCAACGATLPLLCPRCGGAVALPSRFCRTCGAPLRPEAALARTAGGVIPPDTLLEGRYHIQDLLGQGGFARVYLARDRVASGRPCAVKELTDNSPENQRQFEHEASLLRRLSHPHLVRVTDYFQTAAGDMFLVMEYVEGKDLDTVLDQAAGFLPEARIVNWALQVCDVLEYMHTWIDPSTGRPSPIIHRDVKPGNLKLQPDDGIIVIDLGIAKVKQAGSMTTKAARAVSPPYSPLEQYGQGTDERTDVYALGATLYHLATGQAPPEAPDLARTPLVPPRSLNPALGPYLDQIIIGAMQLDPDDRFQTVASLRAALTARAAPPAHTYQAIHALLTDALHRRRWVDMVYTKKNGQPRSRSVLPTAVTPSYIYAVEQPGGLDLIFRVDRISSASIDEVRPSPPLELRPGTQIRPSTDKGALQGPPQWVGDPAPYLAGDEWERVPPPGRSPPPARGPIDEMASPAGQQEAARLQKLYDEGLAALQRRDWPTAVDRFGELQRLSPTYRDGAARLAQARQGPADDKREKEQQARRVSALRDEAFWHISFRRWQAAIAALEEILRYIPGDPSASRLLKKAVKERDEERVQSLYRQAVAALKDGDKGQAEVFLRTVALYNPDYRDTKQLLARLSPTPSTPSAARPAAPGPGSHRGTPAPTQPGTSPSGTPTRGRSARRRAATTGRGRPEPGRLAAGCFALVVLGLMLALALYAAAVLGTPASLDATLTPAATALPSRAPERTAVPTRVLGPADTAVPTHTTTSIPTATPGSTPSPKPSLTHAAATRPAPTGTPVPLPSPTRLP